MQYFQGRTAVITGASSGLGKALAESLAKWGCHLALADIDLEGLQRVQSQLQHHNVRCSVHKLDVTQYQSMHAFARDVLTIHGAIHLLFNNAGVTLIDSVEELSIEDAKWLMDVNYWGVVYGTKAFLPFLQKVDRAHIINISSLFGLISVPNQAMYNASKFAVKGFTESLSMELAHSTVYVSCVHPGGVKTNIVNSARVGHSFKQEEYIKNFETLARTSPHRAATTILRSVYHNKRRIIVGIDAKFVDIVARLFPSCYEKILRLIKK